MSGPALDTDERWLAEQFDAFVEAVLEGETPVPSAAAQQRPHLADRLRELADLAREVSNGSRSDDPTVAPPTGAARHFGDFELIRRLGQGGMGCVYVALQRSLQRLVALKLVHRGHASSNATRARFAREAKAIAKLRHPNIVAVHASGERDGVQFIAMELVDGAGLDVHIADAATPVARYVEWARDVARALDYAHAHGIVHRDVKPTNVRITADGCAMLLDFGLARDEDDASLTRTGTFQGSPHYAPPEHIHGRAVGPQGDVYSLGVTLYECLAGRLPFSGKTTQALFYNVLTRVPRTLRSLNPAVSTDLETVVHKAIEKEPAARYSSAGALAEDLDAVLELRTIQARPTGPVTRAIRWARRRPSAAAAIATALLALLAIPVSVAVERAAHARTRVAQATRLLREVEDGVQTYARLWRDHQVIRDAYRSTDVAMQRRFVPREETAKMPTLRIDIAQRQQERQSLQHELLATLRRAELLDPTPAVHAAADRLRADLLIELWREERSIEGDAEDVEALTESRARSWALADRVRAHDTARRYVDELEQRVCDLHIISKVDGARVQLFRFTRIGDGRLVPAPLDEPASPPVPYGQRVLRVTTATPPLQAEDLITQIAGEPVSDTMFASDATGALMRVVSIDGRAVRELHDVRSAASAASAAGVVVRLRNEGRVIERRAASWSELGLEFYTPRQLADRGGIHARVWHRGRITDLELPRGLTTRTTATPLLIDLEQHGKKLPCSLTALTPGHYLVVVEHACGSRTRRVARLYGPGSYTLDVFLPGTSQNLPRTGFVDLGDFDGSGAHRWIRDHEVTCGEYLEYLNDSATLAEVDAHAPVPTRFPRPNPADRRGGTWPRRGGGLFALPDGVTADMPVLGISYYDAKAFAAWLTKRHAGTGIEFDLPTATEWSAASHSPGFYPFGNHFMPHWTSCCFSRPSPGLEPVLSYPTDETAMGVFDMSGSVFEWLDHDNHGGGKSVAGGAFNEGDRALFRVTHKTPRPPDYIGTNVGFRLVARRRMSR